MFGQQPRLPIDFVFPTHKVMGTLRSVDSNVADVALRKAFEVAQNYDSNGGTEAKEKI